MYHRVQTIVRVVHQTTSQLEDRALANVTLANTGTVICFRTANPEDEKLILPQFTPYIEKGEIASLPSFNFYMRLAAINPEEPFSGVTTPVDVRENEELINSIIRSSRKRYAIKYKESKKTKQKPEPKNKSKPKRTSSNRAPNLP